jgi:CubicO group peptidase (beta-lactamase class C family)
MDWRAGLAAAEAAAAKWQSEAGAPGGAILLFDAHETRGAACGGLADPGWRIPFGIETKSRYASVSKQFLAASVLALGTDLEAPLGFGVGDAVSIGRALDMTGGLPDLMETSWLLGVPPSTGLSRATLLEYARRLDGLNFTPGTEISYSNTGYRLVQAMLDGAYEETLTQRFLRPLGLGIVLPEDEATIVPGLARGGIQVDGRWEYGRYGPHISASGGLAGSAVDLARWGQALLRGEVPLALLSAVRHLADGRATEYGLGLARGPLGTVGHGGSLPGYKSYLLLMPDDAAGVVVLSNREDTDPHAVSLAVAAALRSATVPAETKLPDGLYVAEGEPLWLEVRQGGAFLLGAQAGSAHLPVSLKLEGDVLVGEVGLVQRRFRAAAPMPAPVSWEGRYVHRGLDAAFDVAVEDGGATLTRGTGPLRSLIRLEALRPDLALARHGEGAWTQGFAVAFEAGGVRLVANRSRMLRFVRD